MYYRFFKVDTFCLDSFAHSILSNGFTWNAFTTVLEGDPTYAEYLLAAFLSLCGQLIPNLLNSIEVG
jgi:hypothetical protein